MRRVFFVVFLSITAQFGFTAAHASSGDAKSLIDEVFESSFPEKGAQVVSESPAEKVLNGAGQSVAVPAVPKAKVAKAEPVAPARRSVDEVKNAARSGADKAEDETKEEPAAPARRSVDEVKNAVRSGERKADRAEDEAKEEPKQKTSGSTASYAGARRVTSTAYCLTGTMASGRRVYWGAAAMNGTPLGSRYQVLDGPRAGETFTIEDRIGHGSAFDIAYPGDCSGANSYGRRTITIRPV